MFCFFSPWYFGLIITLEITLAVILVGVIVFFPFSLPQSKPMLEEQRNIVKYIIEGYKGNKVSGWVATCGTKSLVP